MKLIELHILQSFPVSCLNRDDVGSPKTAVFGGSQRARISSQCLKRAVRTEFKCILPKNADTRRGRFVVTAFEKAFLEQGADQAKAYEWAVRLAVALTKAKKAGEKPVETEDFDKVKKKLEDQDKGQVSTALFLSNMEISKIASDVWREFKNEGKVKNLLKTAKQASDSVLHKDAHDIAIFGRMVAADASLTIESASMFSHALSTHTAANDIDYYSAVEEFDKAQDTSADAGAAMIGTLEFTSATYYRYAAVNLDLLFDDQHLGALDDTQRRSVLDAFIRATLTAVPGARKNSMNAATLPHSVLGIRKDKGQPLQLVNAFEKPVIANGKGLAEASLEAMKKEHEMLKTTWSIQTSKELWIPGTSLDDFIGGLIDGI